MKKISIIAVIATMAVAQFTTVAFSASNEENKSHNVVYFHNGENCYHKDYHSAKCHKNLFSTSERADTAIFMQMQRGAEKAHMKPCTMCYLFDR